MANATYRDCRAGFDVFRRYGGSIARDDLNVELVEAGYGVVSDRTFGHYRKLLRSGFDRYISINRFDIVVPARLEKLGPLFASRNLSSSPG